MDGDPALIGFTTSASKNRGKLFLIVNSVFYALLVGVLAVVHLIN